MIRHCEVPWIPGLLDLQAAAEPGPGEGGDPGGGDPASGGGGGGGAGPGTPAPTDWETLRSSLPADLQGTADLGTSKSLESFVRQHGEANKLLGQNRLALPGADSPQSDWDTFYKATGRPDTAEAYTYDGFKAPDGADWSPEVQAAMNPVFHEAGLSNAAARKCVDGYAKVTAEAYQARAGRIDSNREEVLTKLRTEWGGDYDANLENAQIAGRSIFGGAEAWKAAANMVLPDDTKLGSRHNIMSAFAKMGKLMREAGLDGEGAQTGSGSMSIQDAKDELAVMESDPVKNKILTNKGHPQYAALHRRWDHLNMMISKEELDPLA